MDDASPFASAAVARTLSFLTGADLPRWAHNRGLKDGGPRLCVVTIS